MRHARDAHGSPRQLRSQADRASSHLREASGLGAELGDTFLENLQGLTTLKVYQADGFKQDQMNEQAEKFRRITMRVLTMQLNSITMRELFCARFVKRGRGVRCFWSRIARLPCASSTPSCRLREGG